MRNREALSYLYLLSIAAGAALFAAVAARLWPESSDGAQLWQPFLVLSLVALAGRFPVALTRQAEASLSTVPVFMAVLLFHPSQAAAIAAGGTLVAETLLKAPAKAIAFNMGVNALAAGLAGFVFFAVRPDQSALPLELPTMLAAGSAGLTLHVANVVLVSGMVMVRKGVAFWRVWEETFVFESFQEAALLTVGLVAAVLFAEAWWSLGLLLLPFALAYLGFRRIVGEAAEKTRLADELERSLMGLKELQAQLVQSAKMASVGTLAAGVAHEINNPIFAIIGRAELMLKNADRHLGSEKAVEYTRTIHEMGERVSKIVAHLLEYSRMSDEAEELRLEQVVEGAIALLGARAESRSIALVRDYRGVPSVMGVSSQLQQVFVNLLGNSLDATPDGGQITVGCRVDGKRVRAYVADTGAGIPQDALGRVFEPFFTTKEVGKGTGLGLFICHKIVTAHQGLISVESSTGRGTRVSIELPCEAEAHEAHEGVTELAAALSGPGSR